MTTTEIQQCALSAELSENEALMRQIFEHDNIMKLRHVTSRDGKVRCLIACFDGMVNNQLVDLNILRPLTLCSGPLTPETLGQRVITTDSYTLQDNISDACSDMIQGDTLIFLDGYAVVISASTKGYQTRGVEEPDAEKNLRGPRQGFTESLIVNTALLRRCLLTPDLKMETMQVTSISREKLCICYLDTLVDRGVLEELKKRLSRIRIDAVLSSNYVEEMIRDARFSPLKTVGSTEKPDIAAAKLLEGRIAILIDGTPDVLTVPFLFLEYFQTGNDYYTNFWMGSIRRLLRILGAFLSVSVPAIYIALICFHQEMLPVKLLLSIAASRASVPFSAVLELLALLVAFELLGEAGVMMPQGISTALSTVGGVIIGQAAVEARLISAPLVIVVALTGLTDQMVPKMKDAMLLCRLGLLLLSITIGLYGYILGMLFVLAYLLAQKSFGVPYSSFLTSMRLRDMVDTGIRMPIWMLRRPSIREEEREQ